MMEKQLSRLQHKRKVRLMEERQLEKSFYGRRSKIQAGTRRALKLNSQISYMWKELEQTYQNSQ